MHVNPPSFLQTPSFWRLKSLSLEGHFEKKMEQFLVIKCKQRFLVPFRQFVSPLALRHNDVGETGLKRTLNLIWARIVTYNIFQTNLQARTQ